MKYSLLSHTIHKGFTLIEMMIVIAIIGILASFSYPMFQPYLERSHELEERLLQKEFISLFQEYMLSKGSVESEPSQANNLYEWYCIESQYTPSGLASDKCQAGHTYYHTGLNAFFKSSPKGKDFLSKRDQYCEKYFSTWGPCFWILAQFSHGSYKTLYDNWGQVYPGGDITDATKRWLGFWYIRMGTSSFDTTGWTDWGGGWKQLSINSNNMPALANKRCAPGIAVDMWIGPNPSDDQINCGYVFE